MPWNDHWSYNGSGSMIILKKYWKKNLIFLRQILFFRQEIFFGKLFFCKIFWHQILFFCEENFVRQKLFSPNFFINKILLTTFLIEVFKFFNWSTWSLQLKYLKSLIEVFNWSPQLKSSIEVFKVFNWNIRSLQLKYSKSSIEVFRLFGWSL